MWLVPGIFAITVHEVAHGWVAKLFGDRTAADAGRLTLNPIRHIDPIGTILVPLSLYWKNGRAKLGLGLAKGKKQHDKRATIKDRDWERQKQRLLRKVR